MTKWLTLQKKSPKIILLAVMMYVRYPFSLRNVEDLLHELSIDTRLQYPELIDRVKAQRAIWRADLVLIENTSLGVPLCQELRRTAARLSPGHGDAGQD